MIQRVNELGQPVGDIIEAWCARPLPPKEPIVGRTCRVEPLDCAAHADALYDAFVKDSESKNWTYLPYGPFEDRADFDKWLDSIALVEDPLFHSIIDLKTEQATGVASYLRINPADGVIEVGHIHFSPLLQRTTLSTEAMYLMMKRVFDELGYRRYEWKCDALNAPSRAAAIRLGFKFEGIFRQATMYKGRNRDTAWYAIIDKEWPEIRDAYTEWLDPSNFDEFGNQLSSLQASKAIS